MAIHFDIFLENNNKILLYGVLWVTIEWKLMTKIDDVITVNTFVFNLQVFSQVNKCNWLMKNMIVCLKQNIVCKHIWSFSCLYSPFLLFGGIFFVCFSVILPGIYQFSMYGRKAMKKTSIIIVSTSYCQAQLLLKTYQG